MHKTYLLQLNVFFSTTESVSLLIRAVWNNDSVSNKFAVFLGLYDAVQSDVWTSFFNIVSAQCWKSLYWHSLLLLYSNHQAKSTLKILLFLALRLIFRTCKREWKWWGSVRVAWSTLLWSIDSFVIPSSRKGWTTKGHSGRRTNEEVSQ